MLLKGNNFDGVEKSRSPALWRSGRVVGIPSVWPATIPLHHASESRKLAYLYTNFFHSHLKRYDGLFASPSILIISGPEMLNQFSPKERRRLLIIGGAAFILLAAWLVFSPVGLIKLYGIKNDLNGVRYSNQDLGARNQALQEEIDKLQNDPVYLEEIARKKFGLLRKNELIFKFKKKKKRHH